MIEIIENNEKYNRKICPSDWRFSASIVGMIRYFEEEKIEFEYDDIYLYYNFEDINNESDGKYLDYVEKVYRPSLHHTVLEDLLSIKEKSEDDIKIIKEKLKANSIMQKTFKGVKEDESEKIKTIVEKERKNLIEDTFKNAKFGYSKFSNPNKFRSEEGKVCRLNGYYVDTGRKTKSIGFAFNDKSRNYNDYMEFDFIPFAFTQERESIFINNNFSIKKLIDSNFIVSHEKDSKENELNNKKKVNRNFRSELFYTYGVGSSFVDYDVEIIIKSMDNEFFETLFVRKESIDIFKSINSIDSKDEYIKKALNYKIKRNEDNYINVMNYVTDCVLNLKVLDDLIMFLFRYKFKFNTNDNKKGEDSRDYGFLISQLIRINRLVYRFLYSKGDEKMAYKSISDTAEGVKRSLKKKNMENKLGSYRSKLIGALTANDKDRFIVILLNLSSYAQVEFDFIPRLTKDFDANKNLAFDFVSKLNYFEDNKKNNVNNNEGENNEK